MPHLLPPPPCSHPSPAALLNGVTLCEALGVNPKHLDVSNPGAQRLYKWSQTIGAAQLIVLDEFSTCSPTYLHLLHEVCVHLNPHNAHLPFAGKSVLLSGDVAVSAPRWHRGKRR